jgi:hypothetical protein
VLEVVGLAFWGTGLARVMLAGHPRAADARRDLGSV